MCTPLNYFHKDTFADGTGRGKIIQQTKFTLGCNNGQLNVPSLTATEKKRVRKKSNQLPAIVSIDIPLPLPENLESITPVFMPCKQFPDNYISPSSLSILHWSKYHGRNISFYLKDIGFFSTADRSNANRCREDFRYLKQLIYDIDDVRKVKQMKIEFDLNVGSAYLNPTEPSTALDALLWWINGHITDLLDHKGRFTFDFVGWRGTIRKIMLSLFTNDLDWRIGIIRYRNAYFLHVFHTETELNVELNQTPIQKRMCYWGHKFEDYLCSETPPLFPSPKKLFSLVNLATLGIHKILYGSEIDACTRDSILTHGNEASHSTKIEKKKRKYVEIKVVYAQNLLDLHTSTSRKYGKWWSQCFLTGIEQILLGFRDNYGIVRQIQPLLIKDIETRARTWSASSFLAFLNEFCGFVRKTITKDYFEDNKTVYLFYFSPHEKKIKWQTTTDVAYQFLPDWFLSQELPISKSNETVG